MRLTLLFTVILLALAGCGQQGPLVPPAPDTEAGSDATQDGDGE